MSVPIRRFGRMRRRSLTVSGAQSAFERSKHRQCPKERGGRANPDEPPSGSQAGSKISTPYSAPQGGAWPVLRCPELLGSALEFTDLDKAVTLEVPSKGLSAL